MLDLSNTHPEIWKDNIAQLVNVISEVMICTDFENGTRNQACEVILALCEQKASYLRAIQETKTKFIPALFKMMTEVEDDQ